MWQVAFQVPFLSRSGLFITYVLGTCASKSAPPRFPYYFRIRHVRQIREVWSSFRLVCYPGSCWQANKNIVNNWKYKQIRIAMNEWSIVETSEWMTALSLVGAASVIQPGTLIIGTTSHRPVVILTQPTNSINNFFLLLLPLCHVQAKPIFNPRNLRVYRLLDWDVRLCFLEYK